MFFSQPRRWDCGFSTAQKSLECTEENPQRDFHEKSRETWYRTIGQEPSAEGLFSASFYLSYTIANSSADESYVIFP